MKYSEFELINKIRKDFGFTQKGITGIGDDAAVISRLKKKSLLITTDTLVEGKHFILKELDFYLLGYKSLAVNISDIVAMGGIPLYFLLTLGLPAYLKDYEIDSFLEGLKSISSDYNTHLIGGDCVSSDVFFISITLLGTPVDKPIFRNGAKSKDYIYVTGSIGDSSFGLSILGGKTNLSFENKDFFIERHLKPVPRLNWMKKIILKFHISSAIDVSDGLLGDLIHIAEESHCGFELYLDKIPLSIENIGKSFYRNEMDYILKAVTGGEDYEIVFTSSDDINISEIEKKEKIKLTKIGKILEKGYYIFFNNREIDFESIKCKSFTHF